VYTHRFAIGSAIAQRAMFRVKL